MTTENNVENRLCMLVLVFVTYLLVRSFMISKNIIELGYLIFLYLNIIIAKFFYK